MLSLSEIQEKLKDRKLVIVAEATGLSYGTVLNITKPDANPTINVMQKISDYLKGE